MLLDAGANCSLPDLFGWTARDHVAFRGFWRIAELLEPPSVSENPPRSPKLPLTATNGMTSCVTGENRLFINLGTLDTRMPKSVLDMGPYLSRYPACSFPETGFSMEVDAIGAIGMSRTVQLPQLHDATYEPFFFTTRDYRNLQIVFKVYKNCTKSGGGLEHIGTAIALLDSLKGGLESVRENLVRYYTVPLIDKESMDFIGTVTFNFLLIKPCRSPGLSTSMTQNVFGRSAVTRVVGHRDVQLTRDHVPVIYHDFLVSESGADLAPHNLSFDQFMYISELQGSRQSHLAVMEDTITKRSNIPIKQRGRSRSRSLNTLVEENKYRNLINGMRHTFEYRRKGFKGNLRGEHIHSSFTTLEELLRSIPEEVHIDIELKYPMLWEAQDWQMDLYGVELNLFVDVILEKVSALAGNRAIVFTSFSPELCILASHKQQKYPVMFLNESNLFPTGDVRASNLQEAVHFARRWGLPGVVMSSEPFVTSPMLVPFVHDAGLVCVSFGALNDDPRNAKIQAKAGLDAIIVDNVNLISKTLMSS
ncbi:Glycerophosphocholine phosphodiesterase [Cadophora gregata f. sp. sojae]|nr:Glycerophosphocholine phosphodiesterase [Cadophora gregata f. sp. sojae]